MIALRARGRDLIVSLVSFMVDFPEPVGGSDRRTKKTPGSGGSSRAFYRIISHAAAGRG
jgi:hypothetical protein